MLVLNRTKGRVWARVYKLLLGGVSLSCCLDTGCHRFVWHLRVECSVLYNVGIKGEIKKACLIRQKTVKSCCRFTCKGLKWLHCETHWSASLYFRKQADKQQKKKSLYTINLPQNKFIELYCYKRWIIAEKQLKYPKSHAVFVKKISVQSTKPGKL